MRIIPHAIKSIYFSVRDAIAYRGAVGNPNKDITSSSAPYYPEPGINAALQLSVVWSCTRLIAETIATLPLLVYERVGETRKIARDHPLYFLLHDSPNADMTAVEFWEAIVSQLCLWGNSYVLKSYNGSGKLIALDPLNPALVTIRRTRNGTIDNAYDSTPGGVVTYIYADPKGQQVYTEAEVWHIKGFGTSGLRGLSPIGVGLRSVAGASAVESAASATYTTNMRAQGVLTVKDLLKPDQREQMKEKVMGAVFGSAQTGQMMLLEGMTEFKQLSMNPADAQMLESRAFSVEDLCRWYGVPPAMIGHGGAVSNWGTGREQINQNFIDYVLRAYMKRIEQGIAKSLLRPAERVRYYAEYSIEGLLRGDSAARAAYYSTMTQNGLKTRNECRALENDPPLPGGDELTVQSNLIPLTLLGKITNTAQAAKSSLLEWLGIEDKKDES